MKSQPSSETVEPIGEKCEAYDRFLKEIVRGGYSARRSYLSEGLRFGVARRWNSWCPSYFDVEGGCYVLIPGDLDPDNEDNKKDSRIGVVVIDPGFKFIDILRINYQIEPQDITTVIVTHFHPDHMAGLLEYATIMNTSKQPCNLYLNETTFATFKSLQNAFITVNELHEGQIQEIMRYITVDKKHVQMTVKAVGVHHNELGNQHRSLGLILETTVAEGRAFELDSANRYRIGILGDTDGHEDYVPYYVDSFCEVDILILHLGTFSNKKLGRGGKHLYIGGVRRVLGQMRKRLEQECIESPSDEDSKRIVVLSEFGLELADEDTLYRKLRPYIESHSRRIPLLLTGLHLQGRGGSEASSFFARATLAILERICEYSGSTMSVSQQVLTKEDTDELLRVLAFQVLAFDSENLRKTIRELHSRLAEEQSQGLADGWPCDEYLRFLNRELNNNVDLDPLRTFFKDLVRKASIAQVPLPIEHLVTSCELLIERISPYLESFASALYHVGELGHISRYAELKGLFTSKRGSGRDYRWAYGEGDGIRDLGLFWTACLIGVFLLHEALRVTSFEAKPARENPLIRIGAFFQEDAEPWANLLVGDIGCTFGIDPFTMPDNKERIKGIWLKSAEGKWISPYGAECFYDDENDRISYRIPKSHERAEKESST